MMLRTTRYGNGYDCGCCYRSNKNSGWVEDATPEQFLDDCIDIIEQGRYGEQVCRLSELELLDYEQDGEPVYSCKVQGGIWTLECPDGTKYKLFSHIEAVHKILQPVDREAALAWLQETFS